MLKAFTQYQVLLSCEHASCDLPLEFQSLFSGKKKLLQTHAGWDIGAHDCARHLAKALKTPLISGQYSRLLIDLNRSAHHPKVFSEYTRSLPKEEKQKILRKIYEPYRQKVRANIDDVLRQKKSVCHLSIHSFTPVLNGETRNADLAFLYCPSRPDEKMFAQQLKQVVLSMEPRLKIRMNYPYRGNSDGLTTFLRGLYKPKQYLGIEIEMNQKYFLKRNQRFDFSILLEKALKQMFKKT